MSERKGFNNTHLKYRNRGIVLRLIANEDLSRIDITKRMGLTRMAITNIVSELIAEGYVVEGKTDENGKTAIYAVSLGLDGFHGISPMGDGVIVSYMPDLNAPGAVKTGEVELVAGVALKNTLKAAVLKDIAITAG
mgnify:CR=1 FL=1